MLAYFDSFGGLVPCRLLGVYSDLRHMQARRVIYEMQVTAARGSYAKGDIIQANAMHCIPRDAVIGRNRRVGARILGYNWHNILQAN